MMAWWISGVRAAHVIATSFWLGVMLLNAGFLIPAILSAGPAGGAVMKQLVQARRLPSYLNYAVVIALVSGGYLLWWASGGFNGAWVRSRHGLLLIAGGIFAVIAALLGQFVNAPSARRAGQLAASAAGGPPSPDVLAEIHGLQMRLLTATRVAAALLTASAVAMASARYLL